MAKISYSSDELIEELKQDIADFGSDTMFAVWLRKYGKCEECIKCIGCVCEMWG